jgi:hypothetical protein
MKKESINPKYILRFEGEMDEAVLVFIIKKISDSKIIPNKLKSSLKLVLIELITNIISHYSSSSYGIVSLEKASEGYLITASNYVNEQNLNTIKANLDAIKKIKNPKGLYNDLLKSVSFNKSVNLGLIEIYNRCKGNIKLTTSGDGSPSFLTLKIKLDDIN